ncbi:branched-chain amino acid ABC transporter permease [bacterium]|nr:MAG: branched-chain amino acid ABC transporter permease [bacterium]
MSVNHCGDFKETYAQDMRFLQTNFIRFWVYGLVLLLLFLPLFKFGQIIYYTSLVGVAVVGAVGLNIVTGFTGQISLGQGAFLGVGAFSCAYFMRAWGVSFWLAMPMAGVTTAFVGMIFGIPSLRLKGLYLAIATLAAQFIIEYAFLLPSLEKVTGGAYGAKFPPVMLFGNKVSSDVSIYYIIVIVAILTVLYASNLFRSRDGRAFVAVRDHYLSAEIMGINLFKYRLLSFAISSFFVGIAGCLMGLLSYGTVMAEEFTIKLSIEYLAMIIIGGMGSVIGSIFGAIFMTLFPLSLTLLSNALASSYPSVSALILSINEGVFGLVVILFLIFEPDGMAHRWRQIKAYWKLFPFSY